jgi:hypothetical protein
MAIGRRIKPARCARAPGDVLAQLQEEFFFTDHITARQIECRSPAYTWGAVVWLEVDPSHVEPWLRKAHQQSKLGKTIVALMPARTNTRAFHEYVLTCANEIRFIQGRLKYAGRTKQAPFPSVVVIFRGGHGIQQTEAQASASLNVVAF